MSYDEWTLFLARRTRWAGIFNMLAHKSNSPQKDVPQYQYTLFWLLVDQSLLFLLNAACYAEEQKIPILMFLVRPGRYQIYNLEESSSLSKFHCSFIADVNEYDIDITTRVFLIELLLMKIAQRFFYFFR